MTSKRVNKVKEKLKEGKVSIGTWIQIAHPDIAEVLSIVGFDFVIYDTEHAPLSPESIQTMMQVMEGSGVVPLVRVAWNDAVLIKRVLDIGAYGVLVPWVNNRREGQRAVKACRYPPRGIRGCGTRRASQYGLNFEDYFGRFAQEEILVIAQIETSQAVNNLDEILSLEGIDAVFVGPLDLSISLGVPGKWQSVIFKNAIQKILGKCKEYHVAPGIPAVDLEEAKGRISQGFQFVSFSSDTGFLLSAARTAYEEVADLL